MPDGKRCSCSDLMYRNNGDGTRDHKVKGKSSCRLCHGYGYVHTCGKCNGAGLFAGHLCPTCCGSGKLPDSSTQRR